MMCKQHGFLAGLGVLGWLLLGCQHEAALGSTDTQTPRAEAAPAAAAVPAAPIAEPSTAQAAGCSADAECHAVDSYCGSCQCLALPTAASAPKCEGSQVQCFVAPCRGQHAVCKAGSCALSGGSEM